MPDIASKYGNNGVLSVKLNPSTSSQEEDTKAFLKKSNYVNFKKNSADASMAFAFELIAQNKAGDWEVFRTGFLQFVGSAGVQIKNFDDEIMFIVSKPSAGLKKIRLFDPLE